MKLKWYICTLIISLSLLTVIQRQQSVTPNQEIVLQFQDGALSVSETKTTISSLKQKLAAIGVSSVAVVTSKNGIFRIVYYSDNNVNSIKKQLLSKNLLVLKDETSNSSSEKETQHYNFDIFELKKVADSNWDFDGQLVSQLNLKSDRSFQTEDYHTSNIPSHTYIVSVFKTQIKNNSTIDFVSDNTSYNSPEVRAGPLA